MRSIYPACFYREEEGYSVVFPDLDYLSTQGESLEDAFDAAVDCLASYLYHAKRNGDAIPAPSDLRDVDVMAVSMALNPDLPIGEAFANMVSVDANAYAKLYLEKAVRKTLTIPAWLNDAAIECGINFSQTLQEALEAKVREAKKGL